jgi:hypothetical protein
MLDPDESQPGELSFSNNNPKQDGIPLNADPMQYFKA